MTTETVTIKGYQVEIFHDDCGENPREWVGSTLVTAHRRYTFGGIKLTSNANSLEKAFEEHLADVDLTLKDIICQEVYLYDHSGLALSTRPFNCGWDSGQLGYIYEKRSDIRAEFDVKRISSKLEAKILKRLDAELNVLEHWANGNIYGYSVGDESCSGFYGYDHEESGLIDEATATVDHLRRQKVHEHTDKLKQLIKAGVSLQYRPTLNLSEV